MRTCILGARIFLRPLILGQSTVQNVHTSTQLTTGIMAGKATPKKQNNRANPISKKGNEAKPVEEKKTKPVKEKDPKASHLYTDDNPETTLTGTGFKDAATATKTSKSPLTYIVGVICQSAVSGSNVKHTVSLVSKRSLLYQWQTINTMYNRAKHHPKKTEDMKAAMAVFDKWLKETYPQAKAEQRVFKPLLAKKVVEQFLSDLQKTKGIDTTFAELYVTLEARKKLANVLVDDTKPGEADWDKARVDALSKLVGLDDENNNTVDEDALWEKDGVPSHFHLSLIAWAWTPLSEYKLLKGTNKS